MSGEKPVFSSISRREAIKQCSLFVSVGGAKFNRETNRGITQSDKLVIGTKQLADGFVSPTAIGVPPSDNRLYICDQTGQIYVYKKEGQDLEPVLDISDRVITKAPDQYSEQGLLGIAFHPDFQKNRKVYVRYSSPPRDSSPDNTTHLFVLSEFKVSEDSSKIEPGSERLLLTIPEPSTAHNGGAITFGPEGYLYIGVGDGGHQEDKGPFGHASDWYDAIEGGNGQDVTENLLGSILRIDVDSQEGDKEYSIPEDNPLVGSKGLDEHFAWGFRNPWKMTFNDGRLFVSDVGQEKFEEINIVQKGGNYGWNVKEGRHCFKADSCPNSTPEAVRGGEPLVNPIIEYPHQGEAEVSGYAAIAGYIYQRSEIKGLEGKFVFGDWVQGKIFAARSPEGNEKWEVEKVKVAGTDTGNLGGFLQSFGRDNEGHLYALKAPSADAKDTESGELVRIVPPDE